MTNETKRGSTTNSIFKKTVMPAILVMVAVVVSACGGGSATPTAAPSVAPTVAAATASATPSPDPVAALTKQAQQVGKIDLYTSEDPATAQGAADAFKAKYNVSVTITRLTSGPIITRYNSEADAGKFVADVVLIADQPFFATGLSKGWLMPMTAATIPNAAQLPTQFILPGNVGVAIGRLSGLVVNTDQVKAADAPKTWQDLLLPQWKGNLVTDDPRQVPVVMSQWVTLDQKLGDDYLKGIKAQNVSWVPSLVTGVQQVAAGEKKVAFGLNQGHVAPLIATAPKAPVTQPITILQPIDLGFVWNAGVSAKSANPAGGQLFVNFLLSPEGQTLLGKPTASPSVLPNVTIEGAPALSSGFIVLGQATPQAEQQRILGLLGLQ